MRIAFTEDMKLPVTCHQKKDMNHFIYLNSKIFK